jgi:hypothetical protein
MKLRYFIPLIGFVAPTLLIGFGLVIPGSCISGVNQLSAGFATTVLGSCVTYRLGIRTVLTARSSA